MKKFTADEKASMVMESFTSNNIVELCRKPELKDSSNTEVGSWIR